MKMHIVKISVVHTCSVPPGLDPGIGAFLAAVDGRDEPGRDVERFAR
jgi:hypothetical protein